ncbi:MAG: 4a-hydroxytetrahydrobiopterin dehydratase [Bryobacter sp.]|jgi:4a-hydroxytetrahydrobiopterin dehydratase|nr:4a-hydroxytetrahydrobiopterin dehydratase [Bryobacter sp. CoA8 C33]
MALKMLNASQLAAEMACFPLWSLSPEGKLSREFRFLDFTAAFAFLTAVAIEAEKLNHHPEIRNVYNRVSLELTTHDAGGLTALDFTLAARIEARFA